MLDEDIASGRRPIFLRALRAALGRVPLWLLTWAVGLCLASVLVLPWTRWFASRLCRSKRAPTSSRLPT